MQAPQNSVYNKKWSQFFATSKIERLITGFICHKRMLKRNILIWETTELAVLK